MIIKLAHSLMRCLSLVMAVLMLFMVSGPVLAATNTSSSCGNQSSSASVTPPNCLSQQDIDAINGGWENWVINSNPSCASNGGIPGVTSGPNSTWNSGQKPPYYVEQFAIEVLKDVAAKKGVSTNDAVTQEHVVALVAWTYAEGGNIGNDNAFNLWNMGYIKSRPDLFAGGGNADGSHTSFASFDAGVEANAIDLTGSNQSRIGNILTQSGSTAEQVMHTIAYFDETPGNLAWAWGYTPKDPASVIQFNHTTYINALTSQLNAARKDYANKATLVIGPGEGKTNYVDASKLQYSGGSGNTTGTTGPNASGCSQNTGSPDCTSATGNAKILCEAKKYDGIYYRFGAGHQGYAAFKSGCPNPSNPGNNQPHGLASGGESGNPSPCATDCSSLVSVAVDDAFNLSYMWSVAGHGSMQGPGGDLWKPVPIAQATAGDIVTTPEHVEIVDHVDGNTVYTFGSHHTGTKTGFVTTSISNWTGGAWRWTGPGSGSSN